MSDPRPEGPRPAAAEAQRKDWMTKKDRELVNALRGQLRECCSRFHIYSLNWWEDTCANCRQPRTAHAAAFLLRVFDDLEREIADGRDE